MSENRVRLVSGLRFRDGEPEDTDELFALIRAAFGEGLLQYSIYQAKESIVFLRSQLASETFRIAECCGSLVGYYHVVRVGDTLFTKYLAAIHKRGCGIVAPALIRDLIEMGVILDCKAIELDVLAGSASLISLYRRYGARPMSTSYAYKVNLSQVSMLPGLSISDEEMSAGLEQEKQRGFSMVKAYWGSSQMVIGLLGGNTCKILDDGGLSVMEIASLISSYFPTRTEFLVTSPKFPDEHIPLARIDEFIRMRGPERELRNSHRPEPSKLE